MQTNPVTPSVKSLIKNALEEDIGEGDVTTDTLIKADTISIADIITREPCVVAGLPFVNEVFLVLDPSSEFITCCEDGQDIPSETLMAKIRGKAKALLKGERIALNILQHLSGIATKTRRYVDAIAGTNARILDTRKTLPGMREIQKYAVRTGGGRNHRFSLSEGILIKDNHIVLAGGIYKAVNKAHDLHKEVEVEVENIEGLKEAIDAGADIILLDNFDLDMIIEAVRLTANRARLEASGNITVQAAKKIAHAGVDYISVGGLTHSVKAVDIGMEMVS